MTTNHYGIGIPMPEAHITRTKEKNRGRVKIYSNNTIYLEKGEEFEIEIFNPTQDSILAKIEINGQFISSTGLVLKPAQRVYLERYFDVDRKFKFDVYEIENWEKLTKESQELLNTVNSLTNELTLREQLLKLTSSESERESLEQRISELLIQSDEMRSLANDLNNRSKSVQQATKYNGKIKVLFYKEKKITPINYQLLNSNYVYGTGTTMTLNGLNGNIGNFTLTNSSASLGNFSNTTSSKYKSKSMFNRNISATNLNSNVTQDSLSFSADDVFTSETKSLEDTKETGRIEQGSISSQKFETVNMDFEYSTFHSIEYSLLPTSDKPMEVKDLRKYCSSCGKKLNPSDNFCSSCGQKS